MCNIPHAVLFRTARRDDLCPVHQGHGNIRPSDDVFHHSACGLLHCLDLWRWHHPDAVLPAHKVPVESTPGSNWMVLTLEGFDIRLFQIMSQKLTNCLYGPRVWLIRFFYRVKFPRNIQYNLWPCSGECLRCFFHSMPIFTWNLAAQEQGKHASQNCSALTVYNCSWFTCVLLSSTEWEWTLIKITL